ncbi:hypothetical protein SAY86_015858 [Trapa natans]|uniref:Sodium/calcium exchanger membrane region domain-containing protein n=1 Tax=Trapa natans TaxID=22666 RepID=A0AAN7QYX6_TRANT|nr:hypothetical protein SAY86_015858 [Trapa natans]
MAFSSSPPLRATAISFSILSTLLFFFLVSPRSPPFSLPHSEESPRRYLINSTAGSCYSISRGRDGSDGGGLINYYALHHCLFNQNSHLSIPALCLFLLFYFYVLIKTAQDHFSLVTTKLSSHLHLSPSMGAITLLALGNGAPDVFSSIAAVRSGQSRTGFGAILSAGTFVSAFVVGFVAIHAAPFSLDPAPFIRDVLFYMIAALFLFWVYLSGEIFLWQAIGFVGFYVFFVGFVFWMDFGFREERKIGGESEAQLYQQETPDCENLHIGSSPPSKKPTSGFIDALQKIPEIWRVPVSFFLNVTIPRTSPSHWNRFYMSVNISFCPLALLYACNSLMAIDHPIGFLLPSIHFPLWLIVLLASCSLGFLHFVIEKEPPKAEQLPVIMLAFVMSVFWISTAAGELLNCLAAIGDILELPPALLGLTVLAWGNSVGDLVADVAVAKAGQPAMAMAGCFACPMFNMLIGLGSALVIQTTNLYPGAYVLHFHLGIVMAFIFLLLSLMGSLLVITWSRFRVPRFWGFCLVGLYVTFMLVSIAIAKFS